MGAKRFFAGLVVVLLLPVFAFSLDIPDRPSSYVNDFAGVLSSDTRANLESLLYDYEMQTGNQLVILTISSLDGEAIEDFSIRLAERWKIGQKDRDNGIIFLVAVNDRQARIEVGYGLEAVLTDAYSSAILNDYVFPHFKSGDYDAGIIAGVSQIVALTSDVDLSAGDVYVPRSNGSYYDTKVEEIVRLVIIVFVVILLVDVIRSFFRLFGSAGRRMGFFEWLLAYSWTLFLIKILFRVLLMLMFSGRTIGGSSSSRGGFSGGGGGSFGGGGASGSW
ncbi:TPM domain-containing protein [Spirochaetia bacterium 38H-sp]|uniref:TPM domain-containing protein n=1 Tax=Rarispira pelagica TaxID=3141764 RepID=A0ABU9UCS1_9SPIR